ncbi:MAG TPA: hypothetical protein VMW19_04305 [Myxococcota bacterium]|nr:hypothetical protein [Myxococcota bacterium]
MLRSLAGMLALPLLPVLAAAGAVFSPVAQGPDFQVNSYTTTSPAYQLYPSVAVAPNGEFVVVWQSTSSPDSDLDYSIQGQRYSSGGTPIGSQFQVNAYTVGAQRSASVSAAADGAFVVVWQSDSSSGTDSSGTSIQARRFDSNGSALGTEFQVNSYTTSAQSLPSVGRAANGDFVVAWQSDGSPGSDTSKTSVQAQRYASNGTPLGGEFQVNTYTTSYQSGPRVAVQPGGDFIVVWASNGGFADTSGWSVQARRYASDGTALSGQFEVNTYTTGTQWAPAVASEGDGDFLVAWQSTGSPGSDSDQGSIQGQRYDSSGTPVGGQFQVNTYTTASQAAPTVATDPAGGFVVVWQSYGSSGNDSSGYSVQGQRYASNGAAVGSQFQIDTSTSGFQVGPSVASNARGNLVVTWFGETPFSLVPRTILARRFEPIALGSEFQVNDYTTSTQIQSAVASDAAGDFVVVWESYGSPGTDHAGTSIQAQRYDAGGNVAGSQFQVNSITTSYQTLPSVSASPSGDFVVVWEGGEIEAQRFASDGSALGGEFQINTYATSYQNSPDVTSEPDGGFVVVWQSNGSAGSDQSSYSIQGRRYASNGSAAGSQFQVNTNTLYGQYAPSVATDALGDFVVVWQTLVTLGNTDIEGQRFASNGTLQGGEFQVNSYTTSFQKYPVVAKASNGDFVVVWQSRGCSCGDFSNESILGQRFASNGTPLGGEFQVNTYTTGLQTLPSVAQEPNGNFLVTWQSEGSFADADLTLTTEAQRYASDGSRIGGEFQVNTYKFPPQRSPAVSVDARGRYVVAWEARGSAGTDTDSYSIHGQRYLPESESTFGMAAGAALLLALRRRDVLRRRRR